MIFVSTGNEISKAGVLLVGKSPHMFSFFVLPWKGLDVNATSRGLARRLATFSAVPV